MTMQAIRDQAAAVGIGPILLLTAGLFVRRYRLVLIAAGVAWGLFNVLLAKRAIEVNATVTVGDDVSITYVPDEIK